MTHKVWYQSKTFWVNVGGAIVTILTSADVMPLIPPKFAPLCVAIVAIINIALRASASQGQGGLTLTAPPPTDTVSGATLKKVGAVLLALALASQLACAPFKVQTVASYQAVEILFDGVDDGARILCFDTTHMEGLPHPWHCTAGVPGMTDLVYQGLATKLVSAYDAQIRLGPVLKGMKVADTLDVADVLSLERTAQEVHDIAGAIQPSSAVSAWAGQVQKWLDEVQKIKAVITGGKG